MFPENSTELRIEDATDMLGVSGAVFVDGGGAS
jgi:hypothetical protein